MGYRMEERRVKRFQIGDSISPSSFVPVKRKSYKDPYNQVSFFILKYIDCKNLNGLIKLFLFSSVIPVVQFSAVDPHDSYVTVII